MSLRDCTAYVLPTSTSLGIGFKRNELHLKAKSCSGFGRLPGGIKHIIPIGNCSTGGDVLRRNLHTAHNLSSEHVRILNPKLQIRHAVSQRDVETLVPHRIRRVGNHPGAGKRGLKRQNGDVSVADYDSAVVNFLVPLEDVMIEKGEDKKGILEVIIIMGLKRSFVLGMLIKQVA
nr:hypothetical protein Iba_chr02aCG5880 [Ipomoea batatas]